MTLKGDGINPIATLRNDDGEFEIFAILNGGEYRLTEDGSTIGRYFGINGNELKTLHSKL